MQATLTDAVRPPQPMERLRRRFPHTLVLALRARQATMPPTCRPRGPGCAPTTRSPSTSSASCAATPATEAESALLQDACDACCDDTDVDTLLSVAGGR